MEPPFHVQTWRPPAGHPLEPCIQYIFRVRGATPYRHESVLPKGNVDLLFNFGETVVGAGLAAEPYVARQGAAWVGGLKTRPYSIHPSASMDLLGVSLRAEACAGLIPLSPGEILNLEAHDLPSSAGLTSIGEQLHDTPAFADQCALLMRWLMARLRPPRGAELVRHACELLRRSPAEDAVRATAKHLAVSERHLRRLLDRHVGIGPAEYVRLSRFIHTLHRMTSPHRTLTEIALAAGYYDHAHFTRDFRSFSGMTPQEYRAHASGPTVGHIVLE